MFKLSFLHICFILIGVLVTARFLTSVYAASSQVVHSTVRLSVCGDLVAETPEQCDNTDLAGNSCRTLGYDAGTLVCDVACDYDTSACFGVAPTPVPTLTPTPEPTVTVTTAPTTTPSISSSRSTSDNSSTSQVSPEVTVAEVTPTTEVSSIDFQSELILDNLIPYPLIPSQLLLFDPNRNGAIEQDEVIPVVSLWVRDWKRSMEQYQRNGTHETTQQCDVNVDSWCNIYDFSVLLHYVENT